VGKQDCAEHDRRDQVEHARKRWITSVGGVGAPVLAGFSFAAVVLVSDDPAHFKWPGLAGFALTLSAISLIVAVQAAKRADEARRRTRQARLTYREPAVTDECQRKEDRIYLGMRTAYHVGIVALLLGLGFVLMPRQAASGHALLMSASVLAFLACGAESIFILNGCWRERTETRASRGDSSATANPRP
jgi:hypothetical protein